MYPITIVPEAVDELQEVPVFYRRKIQAAIRNQLRTEPLKTARNRKCLRSVVPQFKYEPFLWELRVGEFRVFYDVEEGVVTIRAIRRKPPTKRTEEIL